MLLRASLSLLLTTFVAILATWPAHAQNAPFGINNPAEREAAERNAAAESARQQQRQRQERDAIQRDRLTKTPRTNLGAAASDDPDITILPTEGTCFKINKMQLTLGRTSGKSKDQDAMLGRFGFIQRKLDQYRGKCIGQQGIGIIIRRMTNDVLQAGYSTTRFALPEQDLTKGTLHIQIIPGVIRKISIQPATLRANWQTAFPARPGDILNLRDLEQGLEQMKRLQSQDLNIQIHPGSAPGESDIVLVVAQGRPWSVYGNIDNGGNEDSGEYLLTLGGSLERPLNLNDVLDISLQSNADMWTKKYYSISGTVNYTVPYGYWTLSVMGNAGEYRSPMQSNTGDVSGSSSQSMLAEATIQRLVHRNQSQKNTIQARLGKGWNYSYLHTTSGRYELQASRRRTSYAELGLIHTHYFGALQLDATLANRWGFGGFDDLIEDEVNTIPDSPTSRYVMQILDITATFPLTLRKREFIVRSTLHGQLTRNHLFNADRLSIGSRYTVRGFGSDDMNSFASEKGFYLRNDISTNLRGQQLYAGLDYGQLAGPGTTNMSGTRIVGSAIGARGAFKGVGYDIFAGFPIHYPEEMKPHYRIHFRANYSY